MDQSQILEQAKAFGKQLAGHPRVKAYLEAQQNLQRNDQARRLLRDYQTLAEKLQRQQAEGRRVTPQDAEQLGRFEQELAGNDAIKWWLRAQSDYMELMYQIDQGIQQGLAEATGKAPAAGAPPQGPQGGAPGQTPAQGFTPRIVPPPGAEA